MISWFTRNGVAANLVMMVIVVGGIGSLFSIKQELFPQFSLDTVIVRVPYLGAAPEEVESGVILRIEEAIQGVDGIKEIRSSAQEGYGAVSIEVRKGADLSRVKDDIKARVDAIPSFPVETERPIVEELLLQRDILWVSVFGDSSEKSLKEIAERVWNQVAEIEFPITDILEEEEVGFWLFDFFTRRSTVAVNRLAAAGVDVIRLGDDIGMQQGMLMAPDLWREHLKPRLAKVIAAAKAAGTSKILYHSDGNILPVIEDLIEIGVDILNPIQPECMSVQEVLTQYKDQLAFWGMIGTQTTLPFGKPEGVTDAVKEIYELAAQGARCIVGPTHVIEPDVPWANLEALVKSTLHPCYPLTSTTDGQS